MSASVDVRGLHWLCRGSGGCCVPDTGTGCSGCSLGWGRGPAQAWCLLPAPNPTLYFYSVCEVCEPKLRPFRCLSIPAAFCTYTRTHTHTHTLWISTECMKYMSPSSGPSDACPFLLSSPPSARTHTHTLTHTHPPGVVLRQKIDWHLSCIDLPVADTLSEPVMTKQ